MRLPWPTTRRLMAAVAVVGVVLGTAQELRRRAARYRAIADMHEAKFLEYWVGRASLTMPEPEYRIAMMEKYRRLARYPWLPVPPDPPAPK